MDLSDTTLLSMMKKRMMYLGERQAILARNVANADTPNYKPQDLKKMDFGRMAAESSRKVTLSSTDPSHITTGNSLGKFETVRTKSAFGATPNGNEVVLEEQMLKMSKTSMDYSSTTALYKKTMALMRLAVGENR